MASAQGQKGLVTGVFCYQKYTLKGWYCSFSAWNDVVIVSRQKVTIVMISGFQIRSTYLEPWNSFSCPFMHCLSLHEITSLLLYTHTVNLPLSSTVVSFRICQMLELDVLCTVCVSNSSLSLCIAYIYQEAWSTETKREAGGTFIHDSGCKFM